MYTASTQGGFPRDLCEVANLHGNTAYSVKHTCIPSGSCHLPPFRHVYPDGRPWEPILRKLHAAGDGEEDDPTVSLMQSVRLSDFLSTPSAARALRRAGGS